MATIKTYFQRILPLADLDEYEDRVTAGEIVTNVIQFNLLYQDCFSNHLIEVPCGDYDELHPELGDGKRIIDSDNIDAYFLRNKVITPELTRTANSDRLDKLEKKLSFDQFVKAITDPPLRAKLPDNAKTIGENRVSYLIGDAGMGKTLTILKMLDRIREMDPDYRGYKPLPIYIDLHDGASKQNHPFHTIGTNSFRALTQRVISAANEKGVQGLTSFSAPMTDEQVDDNIKALALHIARKKFFLIFIFDNADRFYFESARYSFFPDFAKQRDDHIEDNLLALIDKFVSESTLGKIGASVLFVCRKYVFNYCRQLQDAANRSRSISEKHSAFQLFPISGRQALNNRLELMSDAVKVVKEKFGFRGEQYVEQLDALLNAMTDAKSGQVERTLNTILNLSHQGLRSFFDFLSQIELDYRKDYQIIDRLFIKPHNLLRLYLTNMRKRFSQKIGHFPNIFLVDGLIDIRPGFESAHVAHLHTYWLKYLILKYTSLQPSQQASSDKLISFFRDVGGYNVDIVRLALGSLADPNVGQCLDIIPKQQTAMHVQLLKLSNRGKILIEGFADCIEGPLCFSFDYLQLVTDDIWLSIPTPWIDQIFVDASIGHTLKNHKTYGEMTEKTLRNKVPAVLYFLRVLQASLSWEYLHRPKLAYDKIGKALLPNFAEIESQLFASFERILLLLPEGEYLFYNAGDLWDKLKMDDAFDKHFSNYEESGLLITEDM